MSEAIVIGAGLGGLACAAKLAQTGRNVLLFEENPHLGGTSYIFRRGPYAFPMGPLSFSYPDRVKAIFEELKTEAPADFKRNHYQLIAPGLDIVYSRPLRIIQEDLIRFFPPEAEGIRAVIATLQRIIASRGLKPLRGGLPQEILSRRAKKSPKTARNQAFPGAEELASPSQKFLKQHLSSPVLRNFLGSLGTEEPEMSLLSLARMWNLVSEVGVWFPSGGIHGLADRLHASFLACGGKTRLGTAVKEILVENGKAVGVRTASGEYIRSEWVVSNADTKRTFLEMISPRHVPPDYLDKVRSTPYTGSGLCIYLGIDPLKVDFSRMSTNHAFFRKCLFPVEGTGLEDFGNRDIEICLWSQNMPDSAPAGKAALLLRASFPYDYFGRWRTGEKRRAEGYRAYKEGLARKLIQNVESFLPGLGRSVEVMEVATPLTYQDWGNRTQGSIAGWTWAAEHAGAFGQNLLGQTPLERLLICGIYSVTELFWGGLPTALTTGLWAAERVLA